MESVDQKSQGELGGGGGGLRAGLEGGGKGGGVWWGVEGPAAACRVTKLISEDSKRPKSSDLIRRPHYTEKSQM